MIIMQWKSDILTALVQGITLMKAQSLVCVCVCVVLSWDVNKMHFDSFCAVTLLYSILVCL